MSDDEEIEFGDIVNFPDGPTDGTEDNEKRWIVLYEEDYENHAVDVDGNVGVMLNEEQSRELYRLCVTTMLALAHPDGGETVIRDMINTLEAAIDEGDSE